jgi:hypothetical protein
MAGASCWRDRAASGATAPAGMGAGVAAGLGAAISASAIFAGLDLLACASWRDALAVAIAGGAGLAGACAMLGAAGAGMTALWAAAGADESAESCAGAGAGVGAGAAAGAAAAGAEATMLALGLALLAASCSSGVPCSNCHQSRPLNPITARLATSLMFQMLSFAASRGFSRLFRPLAGIESARGATVFVAFTCSRAACMMRLCRAAGGASGRPSGSVTLACS